MATSNQPRAAQAFPALHGHQYMSLTTFRKNGDPVPTPVWFAQQDSRVYLLTLSSAYKLRRIRSNAQVEVAPCTVRGELLGPAAEGMARILDGEEARTADRALSAKYGLLKWLFSLAGRIRGRTYSYIEITPM